MTRARTVSPVVVIAVVALSGCMAGSAPETVTSTFDDDTEGWTVVGDVEGGQTEPDHVPEGGSAGGYLEATDDVAGGVWYWNASTAYLGDRSAYAGGTLTFDLRQSATDSQFDATDVILASGDTSLGYDFGNASTHPGTDWTRYEVDLSADGWRTLDTGDAATEDVFERVLSALDELRIRGEYREGGDTDGIDEVELAA